MTTRLELEKKLTREAVKLGLKGTRKQAYIYGPLNAVFPPKRKSPVKKTVTRAKNPVGPASKQAKVDEAVRMYRRFRLAEPEFIQEVDYPKPDVCMVVGMAAGVLYDTVRDGKKEQYIHEFAKKSQPVLAASWDGKQLYFIGGKYDFTQDGIIDK